MKRLLFSVTKDDFEIQTFCTGGKGGQNQNRKEKGVRIIHAASGARGEGREYREQIQNKQAAFLRLLQTPEWKAWHKREVALRLGQADAMEANVDALVDEMLIRDNLKIEVWTDGRWEVTA